ncbi:MAG: hypothetical protein RL392_251 [Pseudomonadota bacterium]|jgi:predicted ATP-binding protein involved in virulence
MRLKKITLKNFRCFEHLEINLHPRLTVFVGNNGAGKTALLDGIAAGLTPVLTYLSSANQRLTGRGIKDTDFRIKSREGRGRKELWDVSDYAQVMVDTYDGIQWDYWRPSGADGQRPTDKHGEKALKEHLNAIAASYKSETPALTPVMSYYGASRGHIEVPERLRAAKQNYDHPAAALVGALDSMSDFREMLAWFDLEESSMLRAKRDFDAEEEEEEEDSLALDSVRAAVVSLLGDTYREPYFNREHKFVLKRTRDGAPMLVNQLSQGYQSMLALAMDFSRRLAIANSYLEYGDEHACNAIAHATDQLQSLGVDVKKPIPGALAMSAPAIMLVDEIDLHLHPSWQQRVLGDLLRTFPLTQFIVTTHSPQVLTSVDASCIRVMSQDEDPETGRQRAVIKPVTLQTKGVASSDLLAQIMGVDPIPELPEARSLSDFHALIQQNLQEGAEGQALRTQLHAHFGATHPVMLDCDRMIRLQAFRQTLPLPKRGD